jgi:nucleoside-diphosphate-sugar epimerase
MSYAGLFDRPEFLPPEVDLSPLRDSHIGITGGRGVLGRLLGQRLEDHGIAWSSFSDDVCDTDAVMEWLTVAQPQQVFHLAAVVPTAEVAADPLRALEVNAIGSYNLAVAVSRVVPESWMFLASTSHVYKPQIVGGPPLTEGADLEPITLYGSTKLAAEQLVRAVSTLVGLRLCVGRIFSYSHGTQRPPYLVPSLFEMVSSAPSDPLRVTSAASERDFLDGEHVVDVLGLLAIANHTGVVNIGSGEGRTVKSVAESLLKRLGSDARTVLSDGSAGNSLVADVATLRQVVEEVLS